MEKTKYFDRLILTNDGGKYSPSIRKLRQDYLKLLTSSNNSQSSIDLISSSLKCDDCQKNDGLFQCCHCNQRLCIRCCNKHYKKVTNDIDYLYNLNEQLLIKIFHIKTDLDQQKNDIIEQCQKWRIDTINTINKAHTLIIQTVHDEYEILNKEYELFVEKEISKINNDKNQLIQMKKGNLGSLISSPSSSTTAKKINSKISMDMIKQRIEKFAKHIDKKGKFSFQVKLPKFHIDDNLRVESCFGDNTRSTNALWQDEDFIPSTDFEEKITKKEYSPSEKDVDLQSDHGDSTYGTNSSSSNSSLHIYFQDSPSVSTNQFNRRQTHTFHPISSSNNQQIRGLRRRTTTVLPVQSSSILHRERLSDDCPWFFYRTSSTPTFIE